MSRSGPSPALSQLFDQSRTSARRTSTAAKLRASFGGAGPRACGSALLRTRLGAEALEILKGTESASEDDDAVETKAAQPGARAPAVESVAEAEAGECETETDAAEQVARAPAVEGRAAGNLSVLTEKRKQD